MSTEQLLKIWGQGDDDGDAAETLAAVLDLLRQRGAEIPEPRAPRRGKKGGPAAFNLPAKSNSALRAWDSGKTEIRFPKGGFIRPGRFEFKDHDDLLDYLTGAFRLPTARGSRWRLSRKAGTSGSTRTTTPCSPSATPSST